MSDADRLRLRQICLVAPDLEPAVDEMGAVLGLDPCHRDPNVGVFGLANALFVAGTTFLEIVAPTRDETAAGRFLERSGGRGGYIAIFDCLDPDARQAHAATIGVPTAYEIDRPGVYRCVQLHPRACRAAMLEFDRTEGGDALDDRYWPAGGDGWQRFVDRRVTRGITAIEATSPAPDDLAAHWGAILQRPVVDGVISLDGARIAFRHGDDAAERLETVVLDAADPARVMTEARRRGIATGDRTLRMSGMTFRLEGAA